MAALLPVLVGAGGLLVGGLVAQVLDRRMRGRAAREAEGLIRQAREKARVAHDESLAAAQKTFENRKVDRDRDLEERRERIDGRTNRLEEFERLVEARFEKLAGRALEVDTRKREFFQAQREQRRARRDLRIAREQFIVSLCEMSRMTVEDAGRLLLQRLDEDLSAEMGRYLHLRRQALDEELEDRARRLLSIIIQRCTFSHVVDSAVSVTRFTDPRVRARVIGRDGVVLQRIKETTGIEVIADDASPDVLFYQGFDGVSREVVRRTVDKLAKLPREPDLRTVDKYVKRFQQDVDRQVRHAGKTTANHLGLRRVHDEILSLLGRLKYRSSYGQNVLWHSTEVAFLASLAAGELGLNRKLARRGALLHDIGKAVSLEMEGGHPEIGAELAARYGEGEEVLAPIAMHHESNGLTDMTLLTRVGDAISGSRPGARRDTSEKYLMRLEQILGIVTDFPGIETSYSMQAGREIWVIVDSGQVSDSKARQMCREMAERIEENVTYPGKIKLTMIREARSVAIAH
jgi:ribonuclease Y